MKHAIARLCAALLLLGITNIAEAATPSSVFSAGSGVMCGIFAGNKIMSGKMKGSAFITDASALAAVLKTKYKNNKTAPGYKTALAKVTANTAKCKKAYGPPSGGSAATGQALFASKCVGCHTTASLKGRTVAQINASKSNPVMAAVTISAQNAIDLAAYLATVN